MRAWEEEDKDYPTQGQVRAQRKNGKNKKYLAKDSNHIGYTFRRQYRYIYAKAYFEIQKLKDEHGKLQITEDIREELLNKLLKEPFLKDKESIAQKIVDNVVFMLMRNGDLVTTDIEKAEVFAIHKEIIDKSIDEKNYNAARSANRDLMEIYEMFPKEEKKTENELILAMEKKLNGETKAIAMATGPEMIAMLWEGKKMFEMKKQEREFLEIGGQNGQRTSNVRSIQESEEIREEES